MVQKRLMRAAAVFTIMLVACSGPDTFAPEPAPADDAVLLRGLLGGVLGTAKDVVDGALNAVPRLVPRLKETSTTAVIGPAGGVVRGEGVELRVAAGALATPTTITLVVPMGLYHEVQFFPHGLQFQKPATLRFDPNGSTSGNLVGTYFTLPLLNGLIKPVETFPVTVQNGGVEFPIQHFSRYAPAFRGYTAAGN
jgi:hypothetical protein